VRWAPAVLMVLILPVDETARAQDLAYRGFGEIRSIVYPQEAPGDADRWSVEGRVRFEPAYKPVSWLTLATSVEARIDNLEQVERTWQIGDWRDRGVRRPPLALRQASATFRKGGVVVDVGKQFVRWGKADIVTPTDRLAPRDFLEVTLDEFLAVIGVRAQYGTGPHLLDVVWIPTFTPSRIPLLNRRWTVAPDNVGPLTLVDRGGRFPARSQGGIRWSFLGPGYDVSASYFDGVNHLPELSSQPLSGIPVIMITREYVPLRMAGADGALPLRWFTVKGEAAFLKTAGLTADDVLLYVVQLERQSGELSVVAGYAGEVVTARRSSMRFAPDRGLAHAFLGRASYTIDANRSVAVEMAVRDNADAVLVKAEYSQAQRSHWRTTLAGTAIAGKAGDFLGQYRRNSHLLATLRYSF
jgi:hypothetical protein